MITDSSRANGARLPTTLAYFLIVAAGAFGASLVATVLTPRTLAASYAWLAKALLVACVVVAITAAALRRRGLRWRDFGVATARIGGPSVAGLVAGLVLGGAWALALHLQAPFVLHIAPAWQPLHFLAATLGTLAMGIAEEVGYRSYGLIALRERLGSLAAVLISTTIFVASHIAGGVPWPAALLVVGSASILFSAVMLWTRSLPLVVALHAASNFVQDNALRPGDGALFTIGAAPGAATPNALHVWIALAAVNALACLAVYAGSRLRPARD